MTDAPTGARRRRIYGAPKNWRDIFIANLGETSNVTAAAEAADISVTHVYKTRRADPGFARRWYEALCEGYDNLEMDMLYRLRTGQTDVVDADGTRRKWDLGTASRCLIQHRDTVMREKGRRSLEQESASIAGINAKIAAMRAREEEAERLLAKSPRRDGADD